MNEMVKTTTSENMMIFGNKDNFETAQRICQALCQSNIVPASYQNNLPNCLVALEMANRIGASPLMIMQNLYIVHGNPAFSSKFLIACINASGKFSPLRYEFKGEEGKDDWSCRAYAVDKSGETLFGSWVSIAMAKKEGWYSKPGSKWQTMPELMLQYRAAAFFQRVYAPEISMGMLTSEEIEDAEYIEVTDREAQIQQEIDKMANQESLTIDAPEEKAAKGKSENVEKPEPLGEQPTPDPFNN